jgi:hypothetical protein
VSRPAAQTTGAIAGHGTWRPVLTDQLRGIAGGLVLGAPFLYTMEVWWAGTFTPPRDECSRCSAWPGSPPC